MNALKLSEQESGEDYVGVEITSTSEGGTPTEEESVESETSEAEDDPVEPMDIEAGDEE